MIISNEECKKLNFYRTDLQNCLLINKIRKKEGLWRIFKRKVYRNDEMKNEINSRINGIIDNFITILVLGEQGTFKSSMTQALMCEIDLQFNVLRICFLYDGFKTLLNESNPKQAFQLDEQVFLHGTGSIRLLEELQSIIETIRKRMNSLAVVGVEDKYFPEKIFTFVLETVDSCILGTCELSDVSHEVRSCACDWREHKIEKLYVRTLVKKQEEYIGFYVQEIDWNNPLWQDYCKIKDDFLELTKTQNFMKLDYERVSNEIMKECGNYKTTRDLKLFLEKKFPNLTIDEKDLLARQIKINRLEAMNGMINPTTEDNT